MHLELLTPEDQHQLARHVERHYAENGKPFQFMVPQPLDGLLDAYSPRSWRLAPCQKGFQRVWAVRDDKGRIVAHSVLTGNYLAPHRANIAVGVEHGHRRNGLARQLMTKAIEFAKSAELAWLDGFAVEGNTPILSLDYDLGFQNLGMISDAFRVGDKSFGQHILTLKLK